MPTTVNVNSLSVVHKGSGGMAMATVPDVCKTPSPGGPIPIPYPNIAQSSSLKSGSTTVKADGEMIGIKGCEFGQSNGDEAGTAGGVKSSVNMKEAKFILYSMDVKIDGANACRLTDKMTMNKENTVCLGGEVQMTAAGAIVTLECDPSWTPCQKKQMKGKAANMDAAAKKKTMETRSTAGRIRKAANTWAAKFGRDWDKDDTKGWPAFADPAGQTNQFYDPCAETDDPKGKNMEADHAVEVQCGGNVKGPFIWCDADVNGASGRQIKIARDNGADEICGFDVKNC